MDCSACLSCGMVVLLVMTGCRLFHNLQITIDDRLTQPQPRSMEQRARYLVLFIAAIKLLVVVALLVLIVVSTVQVCCKANASNQ